MKKNILITGCSGQLGYRLMHDLSSYFNVIETYKEHSDRNKKLDLTEKSDFQHIFSAYNPDLIINCAAITNVDYCEENRSECHLVNVEGLNKLISFSKKHTKIIHISTDYVFDGSKGNYSENSLTHPLNYYGKCKLESENLLIGSNREYIIFRPSMIFDNRSSNFFTWVVNSLKNERVIKVATDMFSTPTWIPFFSNIIMKSIHLNINGLFHCGTDKSISRFEFAQSIARKFNCDEKLIIPTVLDEIEFIAKRPKNTSLISRKIAERTDLDIDNIHYILKILSERK